MTAKEAAERCAAAALKVSQAHAALAVANIELRDCLGLAPLSQMQVGRWHSIAMTNAETAGLYAREVCDALVEAAQS